MKTLIIGGNGYIGSALYQKINSDSIDLCFYGKDLGYSIKKNFNDILDSEISKYDSIILLAGHSSLQMCEYNKQNAWLNSVDYFHNLCEKISNDQLLIYASSASVYGQTDKFCSEKDINIEPVNHLDLIKLTIDIIANKFINEGKNIIGLRFGTVNGYSPNIRSDLMINSMVYNCKKHGFIETMNDWIKRPILGTEDLVRAVVHILEHKKVYSGQYNLCSENSTVKGIAETVSKKLGCEIVKKTNLNKVYDFQIDTKKFEDTYDFKFNQSISSIIDTLIDIDIDLFNNKGERFHDRLFDSYIQEL
jgi:nucleoside-diphosphate-sugar epimerase